MKTLATAATLGCLLAVLHAGGPAFAANGRPDLYVDVDPRCADDAQADLLVNELRLRLAELRIIDDDIETPVDWRLRWAPDAAACQLHFEHGDEHAAMPLARSATAADIQLAASRVAWIASVADDGEPASAPRPEAPATKAPIPEEAAPATPPAAPEPPRPPDLEPPAQVTVAMAPRDETPVLVSIAPGLTYPTRRPDPLTGRSRDDAPTLAFHLLGSEMAGLRGLEMGLGFTRKRDYMHGVQLTGLANIVDGEARGMQIAGLANWMAGDSTGAQLATTFNFAEDLQGLQLGAVNVGHRIRGVQIGLLNVAASSDVAIGLVNINYEEPLYLTGWLHQNVGLTVGLQHGSRYLRWTWAVMALAVDEGDLRADGTHRMTSDIGGPILGAGLGPGIHLPLGPLYLDLDLLGFVLDYSSETTGWQGPLAQLRAAVGWAPWPRLAFFAGPLVNVLFDQAENVPGLVPDYAARGDADPISWIWPELHAGIRF